MFLLKLLNGILLNSEKTDCTHPRMVVQFIPPLEAEGLSCLVAVIGCFTSGIAQLFRFAQESLLNILQEAESFIDLLSY
jgi:hypothetical protein